LRRRKGIPEDVAIKAALEVASVKAQVQAIIRRLQDNLAELSTTDYGFEEGSDDDTAHPRGFAPGGTPQGA
jgi:hypothetical protein